MSLTQLLAAPKPPKYSVCRMVAVFAACSKKDRDALDAALSDRAYSAKEIAVALASEGHHVGHSTVMRHRRGDCTCVPR